MGLRRTITRRHSIELAFHQLDMMRVVHNAVYFRWFERGRLEIIESFMPMPWMLANGFAVPVVFNRCEYYAPAIWGDELVATTRHRKVDRWEGRFQFDHSVSNKKTKKELCAGQSAVTVIDMASGRSLKELPAEIWQCYVQLN